MRYIHVENCGLAAELPDASPSPQIGVLHHVAPVLLVAREAASERERVDEGAPDELVERSPVARLRGADQLGLVQSVLPGECRNPTRRRPEKVTAGKRIGPGPERRVG